jgi:hypothetical protein
LVSELFCVKTWHLTYLVSVVVTAIRCTHRELLRMVTSIAVRRYQVELRSTGHRYHQNWVERFMHKTGDSLQGNELVEAMLNGPMVMINTKVSGSSLRPRVIEPAQIAQVSYSI